MLKITLSSPIIVLPLFAVGALVYLSSGVIHIAITPDALAAESIPMPDAMPDSQPSSASDKRQSTVFEKQPENGKKGDIAQKAIVLSSWWERIVQSSNGSGGSVMYLLFGLSVVSLAFAFERIFHLSRRNIIPPHLSIAVMDLWKKENYDGILSLCNQNPSTFGRVIAALVEHRHCSVADISQIASDIASREGRLEMQKAYPLQVVASLATLLGLLGTVIGMVLAFEKVSGAGTLGNAAILADDISLALMTTLLGLCVAVPSLALYHWFRSRTVRLLLLLEGEVNAIISAWFMARRS